MPEDGHKTLT